MTRTFYPKAALKVYVRLRRSIQEKSNKITFNAVVAQSGTALALRAGSARFLGSNPSHGVAKLWHISKIRKDFCHGSQRNIFL
jgi:hypothetical protein